jgi:hypothetical protein
MNPTSPNLPDVASQEIRLVMGLAVQTEEMTKNRQEPQFQPFLALGMRVPRELLNDQVEAMTQQAGGQFATLLVQKLMPVVGKLGHEIAVRLKQAIVGERRILIPALNFDVKKLAKKQGLVR